MKAVQFDRPGPPAAALTTREIPTPTPGPGEVLVRMIASPVNPSDLLYVAGNYTMQPDSYPATPGFEGVGVVEAAGGGLLGLLRKGKRVAVLGSRTGCWAEYAVCPARQVFPVPADIPDEQAAGLFVNPLTAVVLTREVLAVPAGAWLLQSAAGSSLGKMVIALGKQNGFKTVNVVRRREQVEELKKLGADAVIVEGDGPLPEQVAKATGGAVGYALDPVGGATGTGVVKSLAAGGKAVLYGLLSGEPVSVDSRFMITGSKVVQGFWLADWVRKQGVLKMLKLIGEVKTLVRGGTIKSDIAATYGLDQVTAAVAHAAKDAKGGKVLLKV
ncbi:MAG: zinc-dependent alcohol dehydrogenase family protein [Armatimonadaceae bacterium]